jgi:hydroxymethylpyrimidine pyrophosphatase-like HAD family hydrolase
MEHLIDDKPELIARLRDIRVIYTDLDGTMLGKGGALLIDGQGRPSTRTAEALVDVTKAGIPVVPVTGRSDIQLVEIIRICGLDDFIGESGALMSWWTGHTREERYILPGWDGIDLAGRTPYQVMREAGAEKILLDAFAGQLEYHEPWHEPRTATALLRGRIDIEKAQALLDTLDVPMDFSENGAISAKRHTLDEPLPGQDGQIHAYHIAPRGVSKAHAIAEDLKRRGVAPEHALMIGDGLSDLQCADSVAVTLMVENARRSASVVSAIGDYPNAAFVAGKKGDGWVRMARMVLAAQD